MDNKEATLALGTQPVGKLLMHYALPSIVAMIATSLYNMVDSIFIGQGVGPIALSGLAITFPFMNLSGAFGAAIGVGSSTLISVRLGQKQYTTAQEIFGNNITLNVIVGILFAVICLVFLDPILIFFGASENTLPYAREYMEVILACNVITHLYFGMNAVLRSASKPRQAMAATLFTVILNTVLDPLFIYTFGWGIRGAAYATVLSQALAMCWQFYIFSDKSQFLHLRKGIYRLRKELVKSILGIGISPFSMNACSCLVVIFINNFLVKYGGDYAVGAYAIGNRIVFVFFMICMGMNQGMQPIVGYNFGARKYDRMIKAMKLTMIYATLILTIGWVFCEFFTEYCVMLFTNDAELTEISVRGLKINALLIPLIGFQATTTNFFQSIGKAKLSIFLSLSRQLIFLIPLLVILSNIYGVDGVWASLPASDLLAGVLATVVMIIFLRRFRRQRTENGEEQLVSTIDEDTNERNYSYYTPRSGAAPRSMAPQAGGSLYEKRHKE